MPAVVVVGSDPPRLLHSITEDVSHDSLAVMIECDLPTGMEVGLYLATPLGPVEGRARVLRCQPRRYAARDYYLCVLLLEHCEGQGRVVFHELLTPAEKRESLPALRHEKEPLPVPVARPAARVAIGAVPMVLLAIGLFRLSHGDDFYLRDLIAWKGPLNPALEARLSDIYGRTISEREPPTDRLVLLVGALARADRGADADKVALILAPRDRANLDLQIAQANAYINSKDYARARQEYEKLLAESRARRLPPARRRALELAYARSLFHSGQVEEGARQFRQLLAAEPDDLALRYELAGALTGVRRYDEAAAVYDGVTPDRRGRLLLASAYALAGKPADAQRQCDLVLRDNPDDPEAALLKADVLSARKSTAEAEAIYNRLRGLNPGDPTIRTRLAFIALGEHHFAEALAVFHQLLEEQVDRPEVARGFIDAASSAPGLGEAHRAVALRLFETSRAEGPADPVTLGRLAWVLTRLKEHPKASQLLERAVLLDPSNPELTRQYIGSLVELKRWDAALPLLEKQPRTPDVRSLLATIYLQRGRLDDAERECRAVVAEEPGNVPARQQLAGVLTARGRHKEALALLLELAHLAPDDPAIPVRLAEATLAAGDHPAALDRFAALLAASFEQPALWEGLVNAAAGCNPFPETRALLLRRVAARADTGEVRSPAVLARLAWLLLPRGGPDRTVALRLLERAVALGPSEPEVVLELSGVLSAAGLNAPARKLYLKLPPERQDPYRLVDLNAALKDWKQAEAQCWRVLQRVPDDPRARLLLADVLSWKGEHATALELLGQLAQSPAGDPIVPVRIAEVTLWSGDAAGALARFRPLLVKAPHDPRVCGGYVAALASGAPLDPRDAELVQRLHRRMGAQGAAGTGSLRADGLFLARLAVALRRTGDGVAGDALLARVMESPPTSPANRVEMGGILAAAGRPADALKLYQGLKLEGPDRFRLVEAHAAARDWPRAEKLSRDLLAADPADLRAKRWLADILSWRGEQARALPLFAELAEALPADEALHARRAEVTLQSGNYQDALTLYRALLGPGADRPELWLGFVTAADFAPSLSASDRDLSRTLAGRVRAGRGDLVAKADPVFLARLGRALQRSGDEAGAAPLFAEAVAHKPADVARRVELGTVLAASGRVPDALKMYEGITLEGDHRLHLVEAYAAARDWSRAEAVCRDLLAADPDDLRAKRWLADILSWKREHARALELFAQLEKALPGDESVRARRAEVMFWNRDYPGALRRYRELLTSAPADRPKLWPGYLQAVASAGSRSMRDRDLVRKVHERALAADCADAGLKTEPLFLARLALALQNFDAAAAGDLFEHAWALRPADPAGRLELGGVYVAAGRFQEAGNLYRGLKLEGEDRFRLVEMHVAARRWLEAQRECEAVLKTNPDDLEARRWLADVFAWKRDHTRALLAFDTLARALPDDRQVPVRQAEVALQSGDSDAALARFRALLAGGADRPQLWAGYLQALAGAARPGPEDAALVRTIHDTALDGREGSDEFAADAAFLARLATGLQVTGDRPAAETLFARALALDPKEVVARLELAAALVDAGRADEGHGQLKDLRPQGEERFRLVELYAGAHAWDEAAGQCRLILGGEPGQRHARRWLADVLAWKGDAAGSLRLFRELLAEEPDNIDLQLRIAQATLAGRDYAHAAPLFGALPEEAFGRPLVRRGFVDAAASAAVAAPPPADVRTRAAWLADRVLATHGTDTLAEDPAYLTRLAWVLHRAEDKVRAQGVAARALGLDPRDATLRRELAGVLAALGRYSEALGLYKGLPPRPEDHHGLAQIHAAAEDFAAALRQCDEALRTDLADRQALRLKADILTWSKDYPGSLRVLRELVRADSSDPALLARLGRALYRTGETAAAREVLDRALALKPADPAARRELADALAVAGRYDEARRQYEGMGLDLLDRMRLLDIAVAQENYPVASAAVTELDRLRPDDARVQRKLAEALNAFHKHAEALPHLRRAKKAEPDDKALDVDIALTTLWAGQYNQALEEFHSLLTARGYDGRLVAGYLDAAAVAEPFDPEANHKMVLAVSDKWVKANPGPARLRQLAWVLRRVGEVDRALPLLEQVLAADPGADEVRLELANALSDAGRYRDAEKHFQALLRRRPSSSRGR
jgi:tetratricopeptide (TPR) repeat protein